MGYCNGTAMHWICSAFFSCLARDTLTISTAAVMFQETTSMGHSHSAIQMMFSGNFLVAEIHFQTFLASLNSVL